MVPRNPLPSNLPRLRLSMKRSTSKSNPKSSSWSSLSSNSQKSRGSASMVGLSRRNATCGRPFNASRTAPVATALLGPLCTKQRSTLISSPFTVNSASRFSKWMLLSLIPKLTSFNCKFPSNTVSPMGSNSSQLLKRCAMVSSEPLQNPIGLLSVSISTKAKSSLRLEPPSTLALNNGFLPSREAEPRNSPVVVFRAMFSMLMLGTSSQRISTLALQSEMEIPL